MFAEGVFSADGQRIEWYTGLSGQPTPLSSLSGPARIQAEAMLNDRLDAVRTLARRLKDQGDSDGAELLRLAAAPPDPAAVYLVGGQPVITRWGREGTAAPLPHSIPAAPPAPAAPIPAAAAATTAATTAAVATVARRRWGPLLGLAALLLLIALATSLFGLRSCHAPETPVAGDDLDALKQQEAALRAEMAGLEKTLADRLAACPAPAQPPAAEVKPDLPPAPPPQPEAKTEPKAVPKVEPKPEPKAVPKPEPKPEPKATPKPEPKTTAKAEPAPPPPSKCPPPRPKWKAPEVAILLDGSGSMGLPAGMQQQQVNDLVQRARRGDPVARNQLMGMLSGHGGGPSRLDAAKAAIHRTVDAMPADVDVGLVAFGECSGTDNYKFFSAKERGNLYSVVDGMQPRRGTPLTRGLERAGNIVDGVDVPATLVVVSDGDDSCGGDPCAMARQLKARKPLLKINVVDLDGDGAGACMAQATGGRVFSAGSVGDFSKTMQDATEQPAVPAECRN